MLKKSFELLRDLLLRYFKLLAAIALVTAGSMAVGLAIGKIYQHWDNDPQRGAIAIENGLFDESYATPLYLDQGWDEADSLWFYNTTQGSALIPYDIFLSLEQAESEESFRSNDNIDSYRYLPQKPTFFNKDGLPLGFAKESYQGKDYIGYTCAACHTGQVNYKGKAIRIDGGPAMADMVGFLHGLENAMRKTLDDQQKRERFVERVVALDNDYDNKKSVLEDLEKWTYILYLYNKANQSDLHYGYARLDAFGRIYNRVLENVINKRQARNALMLATSEQGERLLTTDQVEQVLQGVNETLVGSEHFALILKRLRSTETGYPGLSNEELLIVRNRLFNEPNAPVSYPFLWDIAQSDYVQWNGLASNAGAGPLGRNAGEVLGVFGLIEWFPEDPKFSIAAKLTDQENKKKQINFKSSIDLVNLQRLESHLKSLRSPPWPDIFPKIDKEKAARGQLLYVDYCQSCHTVIQPKAWDRLVVAKMVDVDFIGTDPTMADNSVNYRGKSGNFKNTYQSTDVGTVVLAEDAPVVQILTAVTKGVVGTADADKNKLRSMLDWMYTLAMSFFDNDIKASVKSGNYKPDTTAKPYQSLMAYKARSLNGIWATAPYLHNGSVPSLYDLLLPVKRPGDPEDGEYRPTTFLVGSREFDPVRVGFRQEGYAGFLYNSDRRGNFNTGHEYGAGRTPQMNGTLLPALTPEQRWDLVEFLKTL